MSNIAFRVNGLGKQYRLGRSVASYRTIRESVMSGLRNSVNVFSRGRRGASGEENDGTIWALRDVSFEIGAGEIIGIIGRNGAGKSTLLKVLSRITEPTQGRVEIYGRVGSLLEVGTGFHPELTGRENIYLNGAILGMRRLEIDQNFDEIVAFAEVEKFIDTAVKHYSSGMYLRLAFAVAAHLKPEILIVDEVLAVGDVAFQTKCLNKMGTIARGGRTVLFVSHNLTAIHTLCRRGIVLRNGTVDFDGGAKDAVAYYLRNYNSSSSDGISERTDRTGRGAVRMSRVEITRPDRPGSRVLATGCPAQFKFYLSRWHPNTICRFSIYDHLGNILTVFHSAPCSASPDDESGPPLFICELEEILLFSGHYRINTSIVANGELEDHLENAADFDVEMQSVRGRDIDNGDTYGRIYLPHEWTITSDDIVTVP